VSSDEQIRCYYRAAWESHNFGDMALITTLLYTGVRVSESVKIRLVDVDLDRCQSKVVQGKGPQESWEVSWDELRLIASKLPLTYLQRLVDGDKEA
jgi:integrase